MQEELSPFDRARQIQQEWPILIVEDDDDTRYNLADLLRLDGYHVSFATSLSELQQRDDLASFPLLLLERKLADGVADDLLSDIRSKAPDTSVIVIIGYKRAVGGRSQFKQPTTA